MTKIQTTVITLLRSALTGQKLSLPTEVDYDRLLRISTKHKINGLICEGLYNCGVSVTNGPAQRIFTAACAEANISDIQLSELSLIYRRFDSKGIDYMPLKGALLKGFYPKPELRTMGDADILIRVDQYDQIAPLMSSLGYSELLESDHEIVWDKHDALCLELHKRLIPSYNKDYYAYYGEGWKFAKPIKRPDGQSTSQYEMSDEDQFVYLFTHFAKHYRDAGIGIRHLLDLYVYEYTHRNMDGEYIRGQLQMLRLDRFYDNVECVIRAWFCDENVGDNDCENLESGEAKTDNATEEKVDFITDVIFNSGAYGTFKAQVLSNAVKKSDPSESAKGAKKSVILRTVFPTASSLENRYKFLRKAPILLPIAWAARWSNVLLHKRNSIRNRSKSFKIITAESVDDYRKSLNYVGLDYNFKE